MLEKDRIIQLQKNLQQAINMAKEWKKSEHGKLTQDNEKRLVALEKQLEETNKAMEKMDVEFGARDFGSTRGLIANYKGVGQVLFEAEEYKSILVSKHQKCDPVQVKGGFFVHWKIRADHLGFGTKDLSESLNPTTAGALVDEDRIPGVSMIRLRMPRLRELIPAFSTESDTIEYVKETNFNQLYAQFVVAGVATDVTIKVDNINGWVEGSTIVINPGGVTEETFTVVLVTPDDPSGNVSTGDITLDGGGLANPHAIGTNVVSDQFNFTPQTNLKPKARQTFEVLTEPVKTLAHWLPATRQILMDASQLRQLVDGRLVEGLMLSEETQLLYGSGSSVELQGLMTNPDAQTYLWSSGLLLPVPDTKLDAVRRAMTLSALAHYPVDGVVLNPIDWEEIETAKGTDGHYLMTPVMSGNQTMILWRSPVIVTTAIDPDDFLVGSFALGCAIFDREEATIRVSDSHEDFFPRNMIAVLAEERMAFVTFRPEAFVVGLFDAPPS